MKIPHLVQYQGSKRKLAPAIAYYIPANTSRLAEPFCGTCAISIYAAVNGLASSFLLNDKNADVAGLMEACIQSPDQLAAEYQKIWQGQFEGETSLPEYFFALRSQYNQQHLPAQTLFMLARVVKGAIRYNTKGEMNQSCDKRRTGTHPSTILENARAISSVLKGRTHFSHMDYKAFLKTCADQDLIYMDPPYQGTSGTKDKRYLEGIDFDEFAEVLQQLNARNMLYMIGYDGSTGDKQYGSLLPDSLHLTRIALPAGRSAQATLLGKNESTIESLYLSPALADILKQEGKLPS